MTPTEILREIIAKVAEGPMACIGFDANDGVATWKGSFQTLIDEAQRADHPAVAARQSAWEAWNETWNKP